MHSVGGRSVTAVTKVVWTCWVNERKKTLIVRRYEWYEKSGRQKSSEEQEFDLADVRDHMWQEPS